MSKRVREIYFSVDIECDGKIPGDFSMISLGAVVVGIREEDGSYTRLDLDDPENGFMIELKPISDNWIPATLAISGHDRDYFLEHGEDPVIGMTRFARWINDTTARYDATSPVAAAFPLAFDWMFFYWYLVKFSEIESPFGHGRHRDIKTDYASTFDVPIALSGKRLMSSEVRSNRKHTHDPLDDAKEQGELLMNILEVRRKQILAAN
jgi:hypothetical protein